MEKIEHVPWSFDYVPNRFIYTIAPCTIENKYFQKGELKDYPMLNLEKYRKASIIHRLVRDGIKKKLREGVLYTNVVDEAESLVKKFAGTENCNFAFPLGISVNEIIAHDTAMIQDDRRFKQNDVTKIDLGIHIDGMIIDSAFTTIIDGDQKMLNFYDPLLQATKDATYTGICLSGVDANLYEISEGIKEVISSYELEDGTQINPVVGLGGHNIKPYELHAGKLILSVPHVSQKSMKMEEGEFYAVETYASTGNGVFKQRNISECNHFGISNGVEINEKTCKNPILIWANRNGKLPFTQRWIKDIPNAKKHIQDAIKNRFIIAYPPLVDNFKVKTSQYEHTIHIKDKGVEILSLGKDY